MEIFYMPLKMKLCRILLTTIALFIYWAPEVIAILTNTRNPPQCCWVLHPLQVFSHVTRTSEDLGAALTSDLLWPLFLGHQAFWNNLRNFKIVQKLTKINFFGIFDFMFNFKSFQCFTQVFGWTVRLLVSFKPTLNCKSLITVLKWTF